MKTFQVRNTDIKMNVLVRVRVCVCKGLIWISPAVESKGM